MEAIAKAGETRDQFLQLLVTQLRHQDPLEPTKQEDFLSQLAQFSTLEGIENLNSSLDGFLASQSASQEQQNAFLAELQQFQNMSSAANMVGRQVEFETDLGETASGLVDAVVIQQDSVSLRVDGTLVPIDKIREIASAAPESGTNRVSEVSQEVGQN